MAPEDNYLAVLKASFDYDPQEGSEDELAIKENQLLFLLERTDESWWKVKVKTPSPDEEGPSGLVPAAYVEQAERISIVKVSFDYDAAAASELSVQEDEILHVYEQDDAWLLVQSQKEGGLVGYVPENYTEEIPEGEEQEAPGPSTLSRIVIPPSPPRPEYIDPADRVASHRVQADDIKTWAVSEVDKKGKKKKGTLGVGNGAIFFASESDKTPVQKWQTSDIQSSRIEKNKHVHIDIAGPNPISLHFHAGSKDLAEEILKKLESSKALASAPSPSSPEAGPSVSRPAGAEIERPKSAAPKAVHFDTAAPVIIPDEVEGEEEPEPTLHSDYEYHEPEPVPVPEPEHEPEPEPASNVARVIHDDGEPAVALYDFTADGDDEITIHEGEPLLVVDKDSDEWWKVRNEHGEEGVVPAQYVELASGETASSAAVIEEPEVDLELSASQAAEEVAAREEAEREQRAERERLEKERKRKQEAEVRARAAAASAEAERKRREKERERQKEKERVAAEAAEKEERKLANRDSISSDTSASGNRRPAAGSSRSGRHADQRGPPTGKLRTWHDRSGQFKVDAVFLGFTNGVLSLHKANGVVIEVPAQKMSAEDVQFVESLMKRGQTSPIRSDDDEPLESRRKSLLQDTPRSAPTKPTQPQKKAPTIDWFEFFLSAGCDLDDCTRYASAFERDKMDETILPDITESIMRSLGLREGDIIRVKKLIETRKGSGLSSSREEAKREQLRKDEELARKLQAEENSGKRSQAPNLFAGPNGALKNNTIRRGRPQPSKSLPPAAVDISSITSASDQIQRSGTPLVGSPATPTPPPRSSSTAPVASGFDDDAWTNRPASTKPVTPASALKASSPPVVRPPSAPAAPPAPPPPAPPAPSAVAQTHSLPTFGAQASGSTLAKTTESDIFDQLARLRELRVANPPAALSPPAAATSPVPPVALTAPTIMTPPAGYQVGMGMGSSPIPIGQHLQAQQTGVLPPAQSPVGGPRGPFAPVPANQGLLQPLVPTTTGFSSFVPTRPQSTPFAFPPPPPLPLPPQPSFLSAQATGYPGLRFSQPNGFNPTPMSSQPTGFGANYGGNNFNTGINPALSFPPPVPPLPPAPINQPLNGFGQIQSNPTGFNPGFNAMPFNHTISPPPVPQQQPPANTNPANVFAQMKSGTFATDNTGAPQSADKYDVLRPAPSPLASQPTGWGGYGMGGMPGGYGY